uniref:DUF11 domain-containing protein n=1 Tax=candidate division CPR3 bacterium TaxID=2268181 RepID=A0A7C4R4N3_UNCC3
MTKTKRKFFAILAALVLISLSLIGCGGGGGGGSESPAPAPTGTISQKVEARPVTTGTYTEGDVETSAGTLVQIRSTIRNNSGSAISDLTAWAELPEDISIEPNSVEVIYGVDSTTKVLSSDIGTSTGVALGITIPAGSWAYLKYKVRIASGATGDKVVKTKITGITDPAQIKIKLGGGGGGTCPTVTNPTCQPGYHLVAGANDSYGCPTTGTCVQDTTQTQTGSLTVLSNLNVANVCVSGAGSRCGETSTGGWQATMQAGSYTLNCPAVTGYTVDSNASTRTGTLTAGGSLTLNCAYTAQTGGNPNPQPTQTGTIYVQSNLYVANACLSGASSYCGYTENGGYTASNMAVGGYTLACPTINGYEISSQSTRTGTLIAGGSLTLNCLYASTNTGGGGGNTGGGGLIGPGGF